MSRVSFILATKADRDKLANWAHRLPWNTRVELKEPKRTLDQSAKMWAMLSEVSRQLPWHGIKLSADDYKLIFLDALKREVRLVPNINGSGFVNLGRSSSDLSKQEMGDLLTLIEMFGAEHGVVFAEPRERAA